MSQKIVTRAAGVPAVDEKEKRQTDSPVRDMKKKMAANAEKEKPTAEKQNSEKAQDKNAKTDKSVDKAQDKNAKTDKAADKAQDSKKEKVAEKQNGEKAEKKKTDKPTDSKKTEPEKVKDDATKADKNGKPEKDDKTKKQEKPKQNGTKVHNGVKDVTMNGNGATQDANGSVKNTRTPETPQPATEKAAEVTSAADKDHSKETKLLKLKDDVPSTTTPSTDRVLRSTDSPKKTDVVEDSPKKLPDSSKNEDKTEKAAEPIVLLEDCEASSGESRKPDTNFSKSRVKVSPYRRSGRLADQSNSSVGANYTGNNATMEMDITESSSFIERPSLLEDQSDETTSSYIHGLRNIKGRRSYKPLKEMNLRSIGANRSLKEKSMANVSATSTSDRPTGTVVGRKRKPEPDTPSGGNAGAYEGVARVDRENEGLAASKRARLLQCVMSPLRRVYSSTPLPVRRAAPIVGINTDLPLSAPVSSASFDPESLKTAEPLPVTTETVTADKAEAKRCVIM